MDITIIIPSYNTKILLDRCLDSLYTSLRESTLSYEVIVVDNNSTDGSVEVLEKKYPTVIQILNKENIGYGKANNMAIKKAKGECVLLLNSDCVVRDNAIDTLFTCGNTHQNSFIGGKLFNEDGSPQQSAGPFYSLYVISIMLFLQGDRLNITRYSPSEERLVDWVSGACLFGKKEIFIKSGLFDESIFMYMEEIELLYRAKQLGFSTWFCPHAEFIHTGAASSGSKREPVVQIFKGLDYFYRRHYSKSKQRTLRYLLRVKAWFVMGVCGIMGKSEMKDLYAKALAVLS